MSDNIEKLKGTEFSWKKAALKCIHLYKNWGYYNAVA
jgi:hypothetical protein